MEPQDRPYPKRLRFFFNTIQPTVIDAVQAARGVGAATRRFYQEAFQGMSVRVETKFGLSTPIVPTRGFPQGSVSSPDLSKPASQS